jgi:hypothetical protein
MLHSIWAVRCAAKHQQGVFTRQAVVAENETCEVCACEVRVKFRGQIRWLAEPAREILRKMRQPDVSMRSSIRAILVR